MRSRRADERIDYGEKRCPSVNAVAGRKSTSEFLPGHDQKLRTALEARAGGLLCMRSLLEAAESYASGDLREQELTQRARAIFAATWRK